MAAFHDVLTLNMHLPWLRLACGNQPSLWLLLCTFNTLLDEHRLLLCRVWCGGCRGLRRSVLGSPGPVHLQKPLAPSDAILPNGHGAGALPGGVVMAKRARHVAGVGPWLVGLPWHSGSAHLRGLPERPTLQKIVLLDLAFQIINVRIVLALFLEPRQRSLVASSSGHVAHVGPRRGSGRVSWAPREQVTYSRTLLINVGRGPLYA